MQYISSQTPASKTCIDGFPRPSDGQPFHVQQTSNVARASLDAALKSTSEMDTPGAVVVSEL